MHIETPFSICLSLNMNSAESGRAPMPHGQLKFHTNQCIAILVNHPAIKIQRDIFRLYLGAYLLIGCN